MTIKQKIRMILGAVLMICSVTHVYAEKSVSENAVWAILGLAGLYFIFPAFMLAIDALLRNKKMLTVRLFYIGAAIVGIYALSSQRELNSNGHIYIGKGGTYPISGLDAKQQVLACWIGALISFLIAVILHIKAKLFSSGITSADDTPEVPRFVICPNCVEPLWGKVNHSMICASCQSPLEDVHGFYDRHPEIKAQGNAPSKSAS